MVSFGMEFRKMENRIFYKRKLPHWHPAQSIFSLTARLFGTVPVSVINRIKQEYASKKITSDEHFEKYELHLDTNSKGPFWLHDEAVAKLVMDSLHFNDEKEYDLKCAVLMGNHMHFVVETFQNSMPLQKILQNLKKFTGRQANCILERSGKFWEEETFDKVIRDHEHFSNTINYCLNNPVKAGFVKAWQDWKWTYIKPSLLKIIK